MGFKDFLAALIPGGLGRVIETAQKAGDGSQGPSVDQAPAIGTKKLDRLYNPQRDNKQRPSGSCNVTSVQMAIQKGSSVTDDQLFLRANSKEMKAWVRKNYPNLEDRYFKEDRMNILWPVLEKLARDEIGKEYAKWYEPGTPFQELMQKIRGQIDLGYPVVVGGRFTASGHIILVVGYSPTGLICHDPYGVAPDYKNHNGAYVTYSYEYLKKVLSGRHLLIHDDRRVPV